MADPTPIIVSGGGGSRFGETLLILAALALAAWLIFRRKSPPENVVDREPVIARPPAVPTTTGAGSMRRPPADAPAARPRCPAGQVWVDRLNKDGSGGCWNTSAPALADAPMSGAELLASIVRPPPITVPQGATASAGANTTPTAGASFKPHPNAAPSLFEPMSGPAIAGKPPAIGLTQPMGLKPAPVTPPAYAPPPVVPPLVMTQAVKPGLAAAPLRKVSSSSSGLAGAFTLGGR